MKYYVYYDGYGNAKIAIGEEDLLTLYGNSPDSFLKAMLGREAAEGDLGGKGYISVVNFGSEQERDEYLESLVLRFASALTYFSSMIAGESPSALSPEGINSLVNL
jgi:hypothetical protein